MFYYSYFSGHGREILADVLGDDDPFSIPPAEIIERVLALGFSPDVTKHSAEIWPTIGRVFEVWREKQDFLVAVSRDAQEVSVQEARADAYMPFE